jgi:hypothetical protein
MRSFLSVLAILGMIGLAFWAYQQNYATQAALSKTERLRSEIREVHMRLGVLRAEWAYLNRPDRLRDLADINFDRLGLLPFDPEQFGRIDEVAYPPQPELPITNAIEVSGRNAPQQEIEQ